MNILPRAQIQTLQSFTNTPAFLLENAGNIHGDDSCMDQVCPCSTQHSFMLLLFPAERREAWTKQATPRNVQISPALSTSHSQVTMLRCDTKDHIHKDNHCPSNGQRKPANFTIFRQFTILQFTQRQGRSPPKGQTPPCYTARMSSIHNRAHPGPDALSCLEILTVISVLR